MKFDNKNTQDKWRTIKRDNLQNKEIKMIFKTYKKTSSA